MNKRLSLFILIFVISAAFRVSPVRAGEGSYVMSVPMIEGLDETAITRYLEDLARLLGEKLDASITSKKIVYRYGDKIIDLVMEDFQKGGSHVSYVPTYFDKRHKSAINKGIFLNFKFQGRHNDHPDI